jgi:hypothetical protein
LELARVDIHVITASSLRLDHARHRDRLLETARRLRPRLLLLDLLVRLHGVDEICDASHKMKTTRNKWPNCWLTSGFCSGSWSSP